MVNQQNFIQKVQQQEQEILTDEKKVKERDEQFLKYKSSQDEKFMWIQKAKDQEMVQM